MSLPDYELAQQIADAVPFEVIVMAAFLRAATTGDTERLALLREAFPETHCEVASRAVMPGGRLATDPEEVIL